MLPCFILTSLIIISPSLHIHNSSIKNYIHLSVQKYHNFSFSETYFYIFFSHLYSHIYFLTYVVNTIFFIFLSYWDNRSIQKKKCNDVDSKLSFSSRCFLIEKNTFIYILSFLEQRQREKVYLGNHVL